jgi:hypothetical protein
LNEHNHKSQHAIISACFTHLFLYAGYCGSCRDAEQIRPSAVFNFTIGNFHGDEMHGVRLNNNQKLAIEAKLSGMLGAEEYDRWFMGFEVADIYEGVINAWACSEHCAAEIERRFSGHLARAVMDVLLCPLTFVNVLPRGMNSWASELW